MSAIHREGNPYHDNPDYTKLATDNWILLDCLDMIWQRHGFEGMQVFLTRVAGEHAGGLSIEGNEDRSRYLIEGMSEAYGIDFSGLFEHWGFEITDVTREKLSRFPGTDIPIPASRLSLMRNPREFDNRT